MRQRRPTAICPHCQQVVVLATEHAAACLHNPVVWAQVRELLNDGTGTILSQERYFLAAKAAGLRVSTNALRLHYGLWPDVATEFGLTYAPKPGPQPGQQRTNQDREGQVLAAVAQEQAAARAVEAAERDYTGLLAKLVYEDSREARWLLW